MKKESIKGEILSRNFIPLFGMEINIESKKLADKFIVLDVEFNDNEKKRLESAINL